MHVYSMCIGIPCEWIHGILQVETISSKHNKQGKGKFSMHITMLVRRQPRWSLIIIIMNAVLQ